MLPMIVNVNLTKGTKTLAKKKTLVKNIQSIQNLGAIDVLCTDKTGTLTLDKIILQKYINVSGKEDLSILEYAFLNSYYGTGMKNLVDKAIIAYADEHNIKDKVAVLTQIPTSALCSDGASFTPSPMYPTTCPLFFRVFIILSF